MEQNNQQQVDEVEMNRRRQMLQDAYRFSSYIPDDLRIKLEECLDAETRKLVVQLQILAISFGRKLQQAETVPVHRAGNWPQIEPSDLVENMLTSNGYVNRGLEVPAKKEQPSILVVPGGVFDSTKKH